MKWVKRLTERALELFTNVSYLAMIINIGMNSFRVCRVCRTEWGKTQSVISVLSWGTVASGSMD